MNNNPSYVTSDRTDRTYENDSDSDKPYYSTPGSCRVVVSGSKQDSANANCPSKVKLSNIKTKCRKNIVSLVSISMSAALALLALAISTAALWRISPMEAQIERMLAHEIPCKSS